MEAAVSFALTLLGRLNASLTGTLAGALGADNGAFALAPTFALGVLVAVIFCAWRSVLSACVGLLKWTIKTAAFALVVALAVRYANADWDFAREWLGNATSFTV